MITFSRLLTTFAALCFFTIASIMVSTATGLTRPYAAILVFITVASLLFALAWFEKAKNAARTEQEYQQAWAEVQEQVAGVTAQISRAKQSAADALAEKAKAFELLADARKQQAAAEHALQATEQNLADQTNAHNALQQKYSTIRQAYSTLQTDYDALNQSTERLQYDWLFYKQRCENLVNECKGANIFSNDFEEKYQAVKSLYKSLAAKKNAHEIKKDLNSLEFPK